MEDITESVRIPISASKVNTRDLVAQVLIAQRSGRRLDARGGWDRVELGSRFWFRMWGLWLPGVEGRLPMIVGTRVSEDESILEVELTSDLRFYAYRIPAVDLAYRHAFRRIVEDLETRMMPPA